MGNWRHLRSAIYKVWGSLPTSNPDVPVLVWDAAIYRKGRGGAPVIAKRRLRICRGLQQKFHIIHKKVSVE